MTSLTINRVNNWSVKLRDYAVSRIGEEFVWGENDCVRLVQDCIIEMTGEDVIGRAIERDWNTKRGGLIAMKKHDPFGERLEGVGFRKIPYTMMSDGDVVVSGTNMGIVAGGAIVSSSPEGGIHVKRGMPEEELEVYRI